MSLPPAILQNSNSTVGTSARVALSDGPAAVNDSTVTLPSSHDPTSPSASTPNLIPSSTSRVSVQLPEHPPSHQRSHSGSAGYTNTTNLPSAMSHHGQFPRTRTNSSGQQDGKYRRKVGFEAFEAGPGALFAFTCQSKSGGYKRSRNTRVFAVAVSPDESGETALEWLMSELVEDGDEVVAIRVIEIDEGERHSEKAQEEFREEAKALLKTVLEKNDEVDDLRRISVIVEFVAGKSTNTLLKMIALYRPDSLVVGTRAQRSRLQSWGKALGAPGMGSVSRFCVSHSPVPVIVVRPERKVKKHLEKRQNDPKRGQYAAIVGPDGLTLSRSRSRERSTGGSAMSAGGMSE
ncbi:universal stress protein [Cryptococcus neoformans C23]|uniref:Universal stress protein n=2 Tax=Cryptococcus neoformans TaxID=5207 RepID=A0A854QB92_CRYNE|nr:universal stress protein [Cryptococcus neoformans var. grubii H99]AUB26373.1 universal stress protein [Cryptococcus neoformans var. grubii]OWZ30338.1 universal stress protein [Cryptococcus neoformans var. grubii AD2-60a]OWZ38301.1 universal stress protein [Cryptococcus neoformans var. grubii AD1-83a]OWZ42057.1 universal stress protein [Cryptococcus neoformans var. grubii C23]OXC83455.1 universal stress protein [Cryptococcus neoformans var. grubii AD1-7a]OXG17789.1 universal stress protein |eukprot:XP_012051112.1 universal stress protein [Cryptococcus neoformans var. grubii H99]